MSTSSGACSCGGVHGVLLNASQKQPLWRAIAGCDCQSGVSKSTPAHLASITGSRRQLALCWQGSVCCHPPWSVDWAWAWGLG